MRPHSPEVFGRVRTIAESRIEKERRLAAEQEAVRSRQQVLLRQLSKKFYQLRPPLVTRIKAATSIAQLDDWLDRVVFANRLEDVGFAFVGHVVLVPGGQDRADADKVRALQIQLLRCLVIRYVKVPASVVRRIEATTDVAQLDEWMVRAITGGNWKRRDVGIPPLG